MSHKKEPSKFTKLMAQVCVNCPTCRKARKKQSGFNYWFVKNIDAKICPFCRAYEKVYGVKAYDPEKAEESLP